MREQKILVYNLSLKKMIFSKQWGNVVNGPLIWFLL